MADGPDLADTPYLLIDLERVERNIARAQEWCDSRGLAFRPHIKTHKLPQIARMQLEAGAAGIACQKLGEAEVMEAAGMRDITVTFPILGDAKVARLASLARRATMRVAADSARGIRGLSKGLVEAGAEVGVLVECDTGFGRTGVTTPEAAAELAALADALPGLRFDGLMTYPTLPGSAEWIAEARTALGARGLQPQVVSGGGTPGLFAGREGGQITEVRAGTYVFGDRSCVADGSVPLDACALVVRATVVSRPAPERAVLDTGSKSLTRDPTTQGPGHGLILEHPEAAIARLSEEHGVVDVSACARRPDVGDVVSVLPNHVCPVVNLFDEVVVTRSGAVPEAWPVAARGRLR